MSVEGSKNLGWLGQLHSMDAEKLAQSGLNTRILVVVRVTKQDP